MLQYGLGTRNFLQGLGSLKRAFTGGILDIFSGAAPTSVNDAETGTKLCSVSLASGAVTPEVLASGTVSLTGGASGTVNNITVNGVSVMSGAVAYRNNLTDTATDVAANINACMSSPKYTASANGTVITIKALPGTGNSVNGFAVASNATTITTSDVNLANGVNQVNGLTFAGVSGGALIKSGTWSGLVLATGTAGYFRLKGSIADSGAADSTGQFLRVQGTCGVAGADYNFVSTAEMVQDTTHTVGTFELDLAATVNG